MNTPHPIWYNELQKKGSITNRVDCGLCIDTPPVWCGCLAHVVLVLSTNGADGMHHMCEGLTPLLYMEG